MTIITRHTRGQTRSHRPAARARATRRSSRVTTASCLVESARPVPSDGALSAFLLIRALQKAQLLATPPQTRNMVVVGDHQVKSAQGAGLRSQPVSDIVRLCARRASRIADVVPTYRFRVAWREKHGIVRRPTHDEFIETAGLREAIAVALSHGESLVSEGTNLAYLTDEDGFLVWSLRMDEFNAESR